MTMLSFSRSSNPWDNQKFSRPVIDGGLRGSRKKVFRIRSGSLRVRAARSSTKRATTHPVASICSITNTTRQSTVCVTICPLQALVPVDLPLQGSSKRITLDQITHYTETAKTLAASELDPRSSQSRWIGPTLRSGATCRDSPGGSKEYPARCPVRELLLTPSTPAPSRCEARSKALCSTGTTTTMTIQDRLRTSLPAPTRVCLREEEAETKKEATRSLKVGPAGYGGPPLRLSAPNPPPRDSAPPRSLPLGTLCSHAPNDRFPVLESGGCGSHFGPVNLWKHLGTYYILWFRPW